MTQKRIKQELNRLARKYVGITFRTVYIDGEFVSILPEDPKTGKVTCAHPSTLVPAK